MYYAVKRTPRLPMSKRKPRRWLWVVRPRNVNSPAVQTSGFLLGGGLGFQALGRVVAHPKISRQRFRVLQQAVWHRDVILLHRAVRLEQFRFIFLQKLFDRFIWQPQSH